MRTIAMLSAVGALALPAAVLASDDASSEPSPAHSCKQQRAAIGVAAFRDLYGTNKGKRNAFGKCVVKQTHVQNAARKHAHENAPAKCRAERAADPDAFAEKYGTGKGKRNAFGKCVAQTAKADAEQAIADHDDATINAAKACKAERAADPEAFADTYGTKGKKNAFGKCVAKKARAKQQSDQQTT